MKHLRKKTNLIVYSSCVAQGGGLGLVAPFFALKTGLYSQKTVK